MPLLRCIRQVHIIKGIIHKTYIYLILSCFFYNFIFKICSIVPLLFTTTDCCGAICQFREFSIRRCKMSKNTSLLRCLYARSNSTAEAIFSVHAVFLIFNVFTARSASKKKGAYERGLFCYY